MRAAVYDAPGLPLRIAELPDPRPGPGQAMIRVSACGVCGSDLHATTPEGDLARRGAVLGHEVTGKIVEIGPDPVGDWAVGDRVYVIPIGSCGRCPTCQLDRPEECPDQLTFGALGPDEPDGAYAEYLAVSLSDLLAVPEGVSMEVAALCEPLATGLMCVRQAQLEIGDRVLILGAGPIGLAATIWARFFGARRVVVSERVEHRRELAVRLGATDTVDASPSTDVASQFAELTGAEPDVVIEAVGRPGMLNAAIAAVRPQGKVVTGGVCMEPDSFDHLLAYSKEPQIRTARVYTKAENQFILEMVAAGRIDPSPMISHRIGLDDLPAAFEALRRPTDQCKVMVMP
ncbi:MAG: alcohol dehydrogenase catalytic domain-containing protein [Acidimicrobiaceae bacterium]|nr:alcohol dehydrogenase catalytic domain-containing protein [Acidimicrobiaceae bacterium]MCY3648703.1 alcohol dehydrogenase catalytic domain-containing protein [Acidimicrobiaceae bacterium]MDE0517578.1 alcohol dehydrogenase catalytic domain-containing protein [Acidimicrobiaceae bacterium]